MIEATLIFNPNAGRSRMSGIDAMGMVDELRRYGIYANPLIVNGLDGSSGSIPDVRPGSLCIIAGGDGTLYSVLQNRKCFDLRFAILPLGTANNLAASAGVPMDMEMAIETAVHGRIDQIDLGSVNGHVFTQAAGVGFHAKAFEAYGHHRARSAVDGVRAFIKALSTWRPSLLRIVIDGVAHTELAMQITVANTPIYGRGLTIAPDASIKDGLLDTVVISGCATRTEVIRCIVKVMQGIRLDPSNVTRVLAKTVEISPLGDDVVPVHADAEHVGFAPVTVEVLPSCLKLMVPK